MRSAYVGYNKDEAERLLARVQAEGADASLQGDYNTSTMSGHPEWMGYRLVFCDHGSGPTIDRLLAQ